MSRVVPMDEALTEEDRRYLRTLGAHGMSLESRIDTEFPPDPEELAEFNAEERRKAAEVNGVGLTAGDQTSLMAENQRLKEELEELRAKNSPDGDSDDKTPPNYNGWSKADLEAEVDRVNAEDEDAGLAKGTVNEMKAALTAYFTETE